MLSAIAALWNKEREKGDRFSLTTSPKGDGDEFDIGQTPLPYLIIREQQDPRLL
ncbi:hypothetical protein [Nostoc sp.]|uniref:hypothetical protein n=1 Tax=Nostoc sp. TaxID=1180 RepID=UPI002FF6790F